jgi:hypothetical protein
MALFLENVYLYKYNFNNSLPLYRVIINVSNIVGALLCQLDVRSIYNNPVHLNALIQVKLALVT